MRVLIKNASVAADKRSSRICAGVNFFCQAKMRSPTLRFLNPFTLSLRTELRLKLGNSSQHVKKQTAGRITGINALV